MKTLRRALKVPLIIAGVVFVWVLITEIHEIMTAPPVGSIGPDGYVVLQQARYNAD